jgi:hypothetical protein
LFDATGPNDVLAVGDYGQKQEPMGHKETQSETFAKSGISQFVVVFYMPCCSFTEPQLIKLLGEKEADSALKGGDFVVVSVVFYCDDAKQDWVHSFLCFRSAFKLLLERFPHVRNARIRTDGASNFKCTVQILMWAKFSVWSGVRVLVVNITEAGNGKDVADSVVQKQKQNIREGLKQEGGSARTAGECVQTVIKGDRQMGRASSCMTREIKLPDEARGEGGLEGVVTGVMAGIASMYYFEYHFDKEGKFVGMTAFTHRGIGKGTFFSAERIDALLKDVGLTEDMQAEIQSVSEQGDRGCAVRVIRSDTHRRADEEAQLEKQLSRREKKKAKHDESVRAYTDALQSAPVHVCKSCGHRFALLRNLQGHEPGCAESMAQRERLRRTTYLRPSEELMESSVQSSAMLAGQGPEGEQCFLVSPTCLLPSRLLASFSPDSPLS